MSIRIILADDHPVVIRGIKEVLEKEPAFTVIAEFKDGQSLLQSAALSDGDVLLLDLNMPRTDGLLVLERIKAMGLSLKVIVITAYVSQKLSEQCRSAGAAAYLVKTEDLTSLKEVILQVSRGEMVFPDFSGKDPGTADKFSYLDEFLKKYKLTKREVEIIRLLCNGRTSNEIAGALSLSAFTIQTHRKNIFKKLSLDSSDTLNLYHFASQNGLI